MSLASSERSKKNEKGAEEKAAPQKEELSLPEKKKLKKKKEGELSDGDEGDFLNEKLRRTYAYGRILKIAFHVNFYEKNYRKELFFLIVEKVKTNFQ